MWEKLAAITLRNRVLILALIFGSTGVMGWYASKVQLAYDMQKLLPKSDPDYVEYMKFKNEFGEDGNKLAIGFKSEKLFQLDFFNCFHDFNREIRELKGVKDVVSISSIVNLQRDDSVGLFRSSALFAEKPANQEALDSLSDVAKSLRFYDHLLYNPETKVALVVVSIEQKVLDSNLRTALIENIISKSDAFGKTTGTEMHYSGLPYIRNEFSTSVRDEIAMFTLISFVVTALLILVFFRSLSTLAISLLFIAIGLIWCVGLTSLFGYKINLLIGTLPPLMVVIGVQNTIYLINLYHDEFRKHGNQARALSRIISKNGLASFLINITTAVGFGTFYFTNTTMLEQYGIVSFLAVTAIFIICLFGLPVIYSFMAPPSLKQIEHLDNRYLTRFLEWVRYQVFNHKRRVYFWTLAMLVFSSIFIYRLKPLAYMVDDIPHGDKLYTDLIFFQDNFKGVMPFEIVVESSEPGGIKTATSLQKIYSLQKRIKKFDEFSKPLSLAEVVQFGNQAYNYGTPSKYSMPNNLDLADIVNYMPPSDSSKKSLVESMVDSDYKKARISYQMADVGSHRMQEVTNELKVIASEIFPKGDYDVTFTGTSQVFLKGNSYLYESLLQSTLWALVIIAFTMGLLFPSVRMITISVIPNIIPLIVTMGTMGYWNIPLKPSTILVFSISFGITVDSTIHFVSKFRQELRKRGNVREALSHVILEVGVSIIYTSVALLAGFMIFTFSKFQGTQALGWLTGLTLLVGMLTNLFLLPALILSFEKSFNIREELAESVIEIPSEDED